MSKRKDRLLTFSMSEANISEDRWNGIFGKKSKSTAEEYARFSGAQAAREGKPSHYNPHNPQTLDYQWWMSGWRDERAKLGDKFPRIQGEVYGD